MMSNAAFRELGSDLGKQLIRFATSNDIHVERVKFAVEKNHRSADFLSARPNLLTAFDKLWDNQIMPETKICALEGKACHFGRGSNREDLHRNLEFTLRCNISDFWASAPRWRIGIFV
ncbi:MAG: hypothetical protein EBX06_01775 [Rhodobacteraceae bacterium]|nr:hypothetical protein [Paracoccaceae bacterium]